ncbi:MAG TPA: sugar O-acetyltransferase [Candidatus Avimuribaculum pullicola]|nr:sugar O-acetyltransferase [Candidatus Avimuribaculum pullicola]
MNTKKMNVKPGVLYDANYDPELVAERIAAKELCFELNNLRPSLTMKREEIMRRLLGKAGMNCQIEPPFYCDYGYNIEFGDNVFINHECVILDGAKVILGNNVFVAPQCGFYTAGHPLDHERRNEGLEYALPITVGDNVWIGGQVCILPGVTIGSGSAIGAGSVVNKDIPAGVLAAGNPCRVIRKITDADRKRYQTTVKL